MSEGLRRWKPSPSMVVAMTALFVAISGSAIAASIAANSVKSKHIKDGEVASVDVGDGALAGTDIADNSLKGADVDESSLSLPGAESPAQILGKVKGVDGAGSGWCSLGAGLGFPCRYSGAGAGLRFSHHLLPVLQGVRETAPPAGSGRSTA